MKVCSMTYADLEYWVKNKAKPGDLAYYHANNFVYTYHYTKPDDSPKWCMWSDMEKLQEYLSDFGLIDKCLKEINKLKVEDTTVNKRCDNCKYWVKVAGVQPYCAQDKHFGMYVPGFVSCSEHEPKEERSTPFDNLKFYLKDASTGELDIKYICEDCGKIEDKPFHWWLRLPMFTNGKASVKRPGYYFRCEDCDKKKDGKI